MLCKKVKDRVLYDRKLRQNQSVYPKKARTGAQRQSDDRIRRQALKAIEDLTFLLENLPEDQIEQVFNKKNMKPFFDSLLTLSVKNLDDSRIERVAGLWKGILIERINDHDYMRTLVGMDVYSIMVTSDIATPSKVLSYLSMADKSEFQKWDRYSQKRLTEKKRLRTPDENC